MFIDEPEGQSFSDLSQYLGAASALGTAIDIKLSSGGLISAYLNHSKKSLPKSVELFKPKGNGVEKKITKIPVNEIIWFKLKRHGKTESYIDSKGIPMARLPIVAIAGRKIVGDGRIINPGVTSIYGKSIDFSGEITSSDEGSNNE